MEKRKRTDQENGRMEKPVRDPKAEWRMGGTDDFHRGAVILPFTILSTIILIFFIGYLAVLYWNDTSSDTGPEKVIMESEVQAIEKMKDPETELTDTNTRESWKETVFGSGRSETILSEIQLAGLSDAEKEKLHFREADFLKQISAFLEKQNLHTSLIYFEEKTACSSKNAQAYVLSIAGYSDLNLQVIIYPDYPGEYIFMISEKQKVLVTVPEKQQPETQKPQVSRPQTSQPHVQKNTEVQTEKATEKKAENTYDASQLSVYAVPQELKNYIGNMYVLQYSLYQYIYQCGYYQVRTATVVDYKIDGDDRTAQIQFVLDNGKSVSAVYSLDQGTYQFS